MEIRDKIVNFKKYCDICEYKDYPEGAIPCCNCLENPVNQNSQIPTEFKQSKVKSQKKKIQEERKLLRSKMRTPKKNLNTAVIDSEGIMKRVKEKSINTIEYSETKTVKKVPVIDSENIMKKVKGMNDK